MRIDGAMDKRLERWAIYNAGARSVAVATFARMRYGSTGFQAEPPPVSEELETGVLVALLPPNERAFVLLMYPRTSTRAAIVAKALGLSLQSVRRMLGKVQADLARMLEQRRRGEKIDPAAPRIHIRRARVKLNGRRVAAAVVEE